MFYTDCTVPNNFQMLRIQPTMGGSKIPIERRRNQASESSPIDLLRHDPPHTRRETDLLRMRIEHWMELAEAALEVKKPRRALDHRQRSREQRSQD